MEINNGRKRNGINQPPWKANGRYTFQIQLEKVYHNYSGKKILTKMLYVKETKYMIPGK